MTNSRQQQCECSCLVVQGGIVVMLLCTLLAGLLPRALVVLWVDAQAADVRHVLQLQHPRKWVRKASALVLTHV